MKVRDVLARLTQEGWDGEDGVEASAEQERDGVVQEAVVPLVRCLDAPRLGNARNRPSLAVNGTRRTPPAVCEATRTSAGWAATRRRDEGSHAVAVRGRAGHRRDVRLQSGGTRRHLGAEPVDGLVRIAFEKSAYQELRHAEGRVGGKPIVHDGPRSLAGHQP
jgi:hypothetical protein